MDLSCAAEVSFMEIKSRSAKGGSPAPPPHSQSEMIGSYMQRQYGAVQPGRGKSGT